MPMPPTRDAVQTNLEGFGNTFSNRGYSLNTTIATLPRFLTHLPTRFQVADGPVSFNAVVLSIQRATGRAEAIEQVQRLIEVARTRRVDRDEWQVHAFGSRDVRARRGEPDGREPARRAESRRSASGHRRRGDVLAYPY